MDPDRNDPAVGGLSAWGTVTILALLYCFGSLDRQIVALMVEPMKRDLGFTDMQIGLLQGPAFSLFFVIASLPIGWMIDRFSRRLVIFWGTIIWSLCAAGSGLAHSFAQMVVMRAGVGSGEATLQPAAFAIIADLFPPSKLGLPLSTFVIGASLGSGLSLVIGGLMIDQVPAGLVLSLPPIGELAAWQMAFLITGLPSLILTFLIFLVPEKKRARSASSARLTSNDFVALAKRYRQHSRFYLCHHLAFAMCLSFFIGLLAWNPAFMARQYHWTTGSIGFWLGISQVGTAVFALTFHGWLVDRLFKRGMQDAHMRYFVFIAPLSGIFAAAAFQAPQAWQMLALFNLSLFLLLGYPGIGAAALQISMPTGMRGKASAIYLMALNLIGASLGPLVVAAITEHVFRDETALGNSMSVFCLGVMGIATLMFALGRSAMPATLGPQDKNGAEAA